MAEDEHPELSAFGQRGDADSDAGGETDAADTETDAADATDTETDAADTETDADGDAYGETDAGGTGDVEADGSTTDDGNGATTFETARSISDLDRTERVELGVDLLRYVEHESLSVSEAVDRIETITTNPALTRTILDTAELRGVIERDGGRIRTRRGGTFVSFEQQVVHRDGDYTCRRCGASLATGRFVRFESGELGPFGPECLRTVLGRKR